MTPKDVTAIRADVEPVHYLNEYQHCDLTGCVYHACVECGEDWPCSVARAAIEGGSQ